MYCNAKSCATPEPPGSVSSGTQKILPCSLCLCGEFPLEMKMATFIEARFPGLSGGNLDWQRVSWSYGPDTICAKCDPLRSDDLPGELSLVLYVRSRVRRSNDWNSLGSGTIH